jgi:hypothetical protein
MHPSSIRLFAAAASLPVLCLLAACASQNPDAPGSSPTGVSTEPLGPATTTSPPLDLVRGGGSFLFSLDESSPAARWHEQCGKESGGDAAKAEACYAHVREVGSHEGMRFGLDVEQRVVLTSFGRQDGKDAIYLEGPLALRADGEHAVIATFATSPHGLQMEGKPAWPKKPLRFEFPDASTMVMTDEVKGRLVFHRAQP